MLSTLFLKPKGSVPSTRLKTFHFLLSQKFPKSFTWFSFLPFFFSFCLQFFSKMKLLTTLSFILFLFDASLSKKVLKKTDKKQNFLYGRIPPGSFEYPVLNGYYSPKEAAKVCEADTACGGFTFKGVVNSPKNEFEVYFFHYVPKELFDKSQCGNQSFHWTSYIVQARNFTELRNYKIKSSASEEQRSCLKNR